MNGMSKYVTYSPNIVAYLLSKGFEIDETNEENGKVSAVFYRSKELNSAIAAYMNNKELLDFIAAYKKVKMVFKSSDKKP